VPLPSTGNVTALPCVTSRAMSGGMISTPSTSRRQSAACASASLEVTSVTSMPGDAIAKRSNWRESALRSPSTTATGTRVSCSVE
jgi:hypothetical protein